MVWREALGVFLMALGFTMAVGPWWGVWDLINTWLMVQCSWEEFVFPLPFFLGYVYADRWSLAFDIFSWLSWSGTVIFGLGCYIIGKVRE